MPSGEPEAGVGGEAGAEGGAASPPQRELLLLSCHIPVYHDDHTCISIPTVMRMCGILQRQTAHVLLGAIATPADNIWL